MEPRRQKHEAWSRLRFSLSLASAAIVVGGLVAPSLGAWKIHVQSYLSLDYGWLAFLTLRDTVDWWVVRAAVNGVAVGLLVLILGRWAIFHRAAGLVRGVSDFDERGKWAVLTAGGALAGLLSGAHQPLAQLLAGPVSVSPRERVIALLVTAAASMAVSGIAFALWRRRLVGPDPGRLLGAMIAVWLSVGGIMYVATRVNQDYLPGIFYPRSIAANAFFTVAMFILPGILYRLGKPLKRLADTAGRPGTLPRVLPAAAALILAVTLVLNLPILSQPDVTGRPSILLISVDTLRTDHVSCYGYGLATTPNIDALAGTGILFENAVAASTWTLPSHATILTGLFPSTHGAIQPDDRIEPSITLASETLRQNGYRTGGIVSGYFVTGWFGFDQGFELFDESNAPDSISRVSSPGVTDSALAWLDTLGGDPFFLFVHYFDPHTEFLHHADFDYFPGYKGPIRSGEPFTELRDQRETFTPDDIKKLVALYDGEISFTDREIGRLLDGIGETGRADNLLVILTSDHGEEFMEHGWIGHRVNLYDPIVHVPLVIAWNSRIAPGQKAEAPVSQTDLAPAILEAAGIAPPWWYQTKSIWTVLGVDIASASRPVHVGENSRVDGNRAVFSEVSYDAGPGSSEESMAFMSGVRTKDWKYIADEIAGTVELYDLATDPGEKDNLIGTSPDAFPRLREDWKELVDESGRIPYNPETTERPELSDQEKERIRGIGYF